MPRSFRGYDLEGKLGSGGMSTLYMGIQKALNRKVAIKMLHPGLADDENFISRFEREAKTASGIGHRNIVSVIDFGVEDDVYYIVMELVQGMDMKDALTKTGRIPPEVVLVILEEVSYGLEAAHDGGVIHRDIKPSNVMLSHQGEIKVADFGLARQSSDISRLSALTLPGSVLGTPAYMSPEQAAGKDVDHRTDIYSLGVMTYELLTGEKPFRGATYSEIRDQIINHDPAPLGRHAPVTPEIELLVERMLAKDPDKRFQTMRHLIRSTEDCMETLDPTGGLIKHRRKYLAKFAQDPAGFSEELRKSSISSHLDRGFYFKQMGLAKIDDAVREFRYVLFLDPENTKANSALTDLEKAAEESGVRIPKESVEPLTPPAPPTATPTPSSRPRILDDDEPKSGSRPPSRAPAPRLAAKPAADRTKVLGADEVSGATHVFGAKRGGGLGAKLWIPVAAVLLAVAAFAAVKFWPSGAAEAALLISTDPTGAAVYARGPGEAEFRPTGLVTNCRLEDLKDGPWEIRVELAGRKPEVRRVEMAGGEQTVALSLAPATSEGRFELATVPTGASVALRRAGETEFRALSAKTPLTSEPIAAGSWEVRAEVAGVGRVTRRIEVLPGGLVELSWDLTRDREAGGFRVASDPSGAAARIRAKGTRDFSGAKTTPATFEDLAVGVYEVKVEKSGHTPITREFTVASGGVENLTIALAKTTAGSEDAPATGGSSFAKGRDGYASIVISPFADIFVDGRSFQSQARRAVIPLSAGKSHTVELRHPTFGTRTIKNVKAAAGDTVDLGRYTFKWGQVRVFCKPSVPATVLIDGKEMPRQTPYSEKLVAGDHRVSVRKTGYKVQEVIVSDPAGGERRVRPNSAGEVSVEIPADAEMRIQFVLVKEGG